MVRRPRSRDASPRSASGSPAPKALGLSLAHFGGKDGARLLDFAELAPGHRGSARGGCPYGGLPSEDGGKDAEIVGEGGEDSASGAKGLAAMPNSVSGLQVSPLKVAPALQQDARLERIARILQLGL